MYGWTLIASLIIGIAAWVLIAGFVRTWRLYHGVHVITCPENLRAAAVRVNVLEAAKWNALSGESDLSLRTCTRWPEMAGCDEACLSQIESSPRACAVTTIVSNWYANKQCHFCGKAIGEISWHERPPALWALDGITHEWKDLAPEDLPTLFATADPVCWACHVVETFRREHPEKVLEARRLSETRKVIPPSAAMY
jgi:hypothetical protein